MRSVDCGEDGPSAQALLARHRDLRGQIQAYEGDMNTLNAQADSLIASGTRFSLLFLRYYLVLIVRFVDTEYLCLI